MSKKMLAILTAALLAVVQLPPLAFAATTGLELSSSTASPGDKIIVSGTADTNTWISIKMVDSEGDIVVFDAVKSKDDGSYSYTCQVPSIPKDTLTVVAGYGSNVAAKELKVQTSVNNGDDDNDGDNNGHSHGSGEGSISIPGTASPSSDIAGHWAEENIQQLKAKGAITGYPDGSFKPDHHITRAEFVTVLVKAYGMPAAAGKVFSDTANHWARDYIATAYRAGIVTGYSESGFGPNDLITREQMVVMVAKAAKIEATSTKVSFKDSGKISKWAIGYLAAVTDKGIIGGYPNGTFNPQGKATRAEAVTAIVKALK